MQNIFVGIIIFFGVILQTSFLPNFFPTGLIPDVVLVMIIIWTAKADFNAIWVRAIFAGLMFDLLSFWPIGINIFSFVAVAFATNSLCKRFLVPQSVRRFLIIGIAVVVGTMINQLIVAIGINLQNFSWNNLEIFNQALILKPICNLIILAILYWPLEKIEEVFRHQNKMIIKR
ncbi:MAG: rod shape-determining protein MreD [Candidatus Moranbacteria bacterium]|nr:rod shape-determining protein MreD [Candidatus Moranbacteria bacterium]